MNDITLGGSSAVIAADVALIRSQGTTQGLFLNDKKCEAISVNGHINEISLQQFIQYTPPSSTLLGAPLTLGKAMNDCLRNRCIDLEIKSHLKIKIDHGSRCARFVTCFIQCSFNTLFEHHRVVDIFLNLISIIYFGQH